MSDNNSMAPSERQTTSVGPGSKDEPFQQLNVPIDHTKINRTDNTSMPYELMQFTQHLGELFTLSINIRNNLKSAITNVSVTDTQKRALNQVLSKIELINKTIMDIPNIVTEVYK